MIDLEGLEKLDLEKCLTVRKTLTDLKKVNSEVEMCYKQAQVEVSKATQNLEQIEFKQMILNNEIKDAKTICALSLFLLRK